MLILPSKDNLQEGVLMNKKSFWLYVVIMTMAVIAVVLAIFILVVTCLLYTSDAADEL